MGYGWSGDCSRGQLRRVSQTCATFADVPWGASALLAVTAVRGRSAESAVLSHTPSCRTTFACSTHEFKYSSFHETNAAARAAADAAVTLAAAERAERDAEKAEKAAAERSKAKGGATGPSVAQRLKQGMERVGEAAAAEAMGASDIAALSGERRMRAALRAKEERQRPPGVLYLNERDAQVGAGLGWEC